MSFWTKRKAAVEAEAQARRDAEARAIEQTQAQRSDEDLLAEADLPVPEAIEGPEQLRAFLATNLPQRLKTRALRHHWGTNPVLANLDGLLEYGEDYTDAARCVPGMQTVYQVGKGMFDKVLEAADRLERIASDTAPAGAGEADMSDPATDTPPELIAVRAPEPAAPQPVTAPSETLASADPDPAPPTRARRMRFHFDTGATPA